MRIILFGLVVFLVACSNDSGTNATQVQPQKYYCGINQKTYYSENDYQRECVQQQKYFYCSVNGLTYTSEIEFNTKCVQPVVFYCNLNGMSYYSQFEYQQYCVQTQPVYSSSSITFGVSSSSTVSTTRVSCGSEYYQCPSQMAFSISQQCDELAQQFVAAGLANSTAMKNAGASLVAQYGCTQR